MPSANGSHFVATSGLYFVVTMRNNTEISLHIKWILAYVIHSDNHTPETNNIGHFNESATLWLQERNMINTPLLWLFWFYKNSELIYPIPLPLFLRVIDWY